MRIQDVDSNYKSYLKISDLDNAFSIRQDTRGNYVFNLNETVYIDIDEDDLDEYVTNCNCHWPLISYNLYQTTRLAWLLMKINNVDAKHMFDSIPASTAIKFLNMDSVQPILKSINGYM